MQRPYQGYPYVRPPVHDAPSIDTTTANKWANLPRKQVVLPVRRTQPNHFTNTHHSSGDTPVKTSPLEPEPTPVVYVEPEYSGNHVITLTSHRSNSTDDEEPAPTSDTRKGKQQSGSEPVVYIEVPDEDTTGSVVATAARSEQAEPEYIQDTIFFNPFENRRIEMHKEEGPDSESDEESNMSSHTPRVRPLPPIRPQYLDMGGAGSSGAGSSSMTPSRLPALMSKESMVYGADENGFPMSPIPVSQFPEPPPAYTEIDRVTSPGDSEPIVEQPRPEELPRTQVILPSDRSSSPIDVSNSERKYLDCQHCGQRVQALLIKEIGTLTHVTAMCLGIACMLPCIAVIYYTDALKLKNHYCPNCNKLIGYQLPFGSDNIRFVN